VNFPLIHLHHVTEFSFLIFVACFVSFFLLVVLVRPSISPHPHLHRHLQSYRNRCRLLPFACSTNTLPNTWSLMAVRSLALYLLCIHLINSFPASLCFIFWIIPHDPHPIFWYMWCDETPHCVFRSMNSLVVKTLNDEKLHHVYLLFARLNFSRVFSLLSPSSHSLGQSSAGRTRPHVACARPDRRRLAVGGASPAGARSRGRGCGRCTGCVCMRCVCECVCGHRCR
jgi:hypothetical protein